jgi:isocitrate/isopropylmalate dehydrogenase
MAIPHTSPCIELFVPNFYSGEYAMLEHENVSGVVESLKIVTEVNTERLCRFAFDHARLHGRKKVTLVHKAVIVFMFFLISICLGSL